MKAKGKWAEAARMGARACYEWMDQAGMPASGFVNPAAIRGPIRPGGFRLDVIDRFVARWRAGDRLADETLSVLFELIVERGDPVPRSLRDFAILTIRGDRQAKLKKSPWENAERDNEIRLRIEAVRRANPGMALYATQERKGDGTSAFEIVAKERNMDPGAIEKIWRNASKGLTAK